MKRRIKLMADYYSYPLWWANTKVGNINPATLPLCENTIKNLATWSEKYNATLNEDYPPDSGFATSQEEEVFEKEGIRLWLQLRKELSLEYEVVHYSYRLSRLLIHPNELKYFSE